MYNHSSFWAVDLPSVIRSSPSLQATLGQWLTVVGSWAPSIFTSVQDKLKGIIYTSRFLTGSECFHTDFWLKSHPPLGSFPSWPSFSHSAAAFACKCLLNESFPCESVFPGLPSDEPTNDPGSPDPLFQQSLNAKQVTSHPALAKDISSLVPSKLPHSRNK